MDATLIETAIEQTLAAVPGSAFPQRLVIGFSGGLDSSVLLHLLAKLAPVCGFSVSALHVHHGLSPHADDWAAHCERVALSLNVSLAVQRVQVTVAGEGLRKLVTGEMGKKELRGAKGAARGKIMKVVWLIEKIREAVNQLERTNANARAVGEKLVLNF